MTGSDPLSERAVAVVQEAIRAASGDATLEVGPADTMETVAGWDSLTFMSVWSAVNEAFAIAPDFDDAIHYIAMPTLIEYLRKQQTP